MRTYEPAPGETIDHTTATICRQASKFGCTVEANFNDVILSADPSSKPEALKSFYFAELKRKQDEYTASPEYAERCREEEKAAAEKKCRRDAALADAPAKPTWKDEPIWQSWVDKNQDPYGAACMTYAERWARLMEGQMNKGKKIAECAEEMSSLADEEGITGFMYGVAVSMLAKAWVHGEALRLWHNIKTQIGHEGEAANETGGTLNPALLNIGKRKGTNK